MEPYDCVIPLEGKATFLSRLVGDAALKGQIEAARTDVFGKYPDANRAHSDTYLLYMFCTSVLSDPKLSAEERFRAILEFRQALAQPAASETQPERAPKNVPEPIAPDKN